MSQLLSIEDAFGRLHGLVKAIGDVETISILNATGRTLLEPVRAPIDLPPFDASAMDGYAVCHDDDKETSTGFRVVGESLAGHPFNESIRQGECTRIFTGAMLPDGATAVVLQEDVDRSENAIRLRPTDSIELGQHIRKTGSDVKKGQTLLPVNHAINDFHTGWLTACGIDQVKVRRKPKIGIFSTGDELQDPQKPLKRGQIYDSNRVSLAQLLRHQAVDVCDYGRLADEPNLIRSKIQEAANDVDLLLTSGGVSVGDSDFVRPAIEDIGELTFWNIALKPGKPLAVGQIDRCIFVGLPGNPVSVIVTYLLFVNQILDLLNGQDSNSPLKIEAALLSDLHHTPGRREYQRGKLTKEGETLRVTVLTDQSSNRLTSFAEANCLIEVDESCGDLPSGTNVKVVLLSKKSSHIWSL